jgi:DNA polymerase-1
MYPPRKKKTKYKLTCIIDGTALLKVAYHGASNLYNSKGVHIGGLFQFFSIMRKVIKENNVTNIVVFWDGELSGKLRHNIYPEYKQNRKKDYRNGLKDIDEELEYQKIRIKQYLEELSIKQFEDEVVEADDCIAYYILNRSDDERILICTGDRDLCQLIEQDVSVYLFDKKRIASIDNYNFVFEYDIRNLRLIKIIAGDTSDNIKGIEKIGPKKAEKILTGCVTEQELFNAVREAYSNDEEFLMNGRVLWIRRKENEDWKERFDTLVQEQARRTSLEDSKE